MFLRGRPPGPLIVRIEAGFLLTYTKATGPGGKGQSQLEMGPRVALAIRNATTGNWLNLRRFGCPAWALADLARLTWPNTQALPQLQYSTPQLGPCP